MPESGSIQRHPFTSLILLLLLVLAGAVVFTILALIVAGSIYGIAPLFDVVNGKQTSDLNFLKVVQIFSSFGMFVVAALVFARIESKHWSNFLNLDSKFPLILLILTFALMFSATPVLEWSVEFNKGMKLPYFLKGLEEWMQLKENQMAQLTQQLLVMKGLPDLLVDMLMFAVIPAVGEELIFRGCLQKIFVQWFGNIHWGIWITAIVFSAIHIQFYGFLPRMLLGALFGYLLIWSKSLWLPILAHFINNATAVITAYVYQQKGISLEKLDQPELIPWPVYLLSFLATSILLYTIYQKSTKVNTVQISK